MYRLNRSLSATILRDIALGAFSQKLRTPLAQRRTRRDIPTSLLPGTSLLRLGAETTLPQRVLNHLLQSGLCALLAQRGLAAAELHVTEMDQVAKVGALGF